MPPPSASGRPSRTSAGCRAGAPRSFTPADDGSGATVLTQRRETPDGISTISRTFIDRLFGGVADFQVELGVGMRETLAKIKADAER